MTKTNVNVQYQSLAEYIASKPIGTADDAGTGFYLMASNNIDAYHITPTTDKSDWLCDCKSFQFRHDCKHRQYIWHLCELKRQAKFAQLQTALQEGLARAESELAKARAGLDNRVRNTHYTLTRQEFIDLSNRVTFYQMEVQKWASKLNTAATPSHQSVNWSSYQASHIVEKKVA